MKITFIGHRTVFNCKNLTEIIRKTILENTNSNEHILFYCGGYGDFDNLCANVCRSIKKERENSELVYVTPYITESHQKKIEYLMSLKLYDSTVYPELENVPYRLAIIKRNEWMITEADLVISYINHEYGGAYKSFLFAKRKNKRFINLAK